MKSYSDTISSMKVKKLAISRRNFIKTGGVLPFAAAAAAGLFSSTNAHAAKPQILQSDHVIGFPTAPITIIEYASLTCGHCGNFHNFTYSDLKKNYVDSGKAKFVYRHFPLDRFAFIAAILSECTSDDSAFFEMIGTLFEQQGVWTRASDPALALIEIGEQNGISLEQFVSCLTDQELVDGIASESLIGSTQFGVDSTPTLFIQGEKYLRDRSFEAMDSYLKMLT